MWYESAPILEGIHSLSISLLSGRASRSSPLGIPISSAHPYIPTPQEESEDFCSQGLIRRKGEALETDESRDAAYAARDLRGPRRSWFCRLLFPWFWIIRCQRLTIASVPQSTSVPTVSGDANMIYSLKHRKVSTLPTQIMTGL